MLLPFMRKKLGGKVPVPPAKEGAKARDSEPPPPAPAGKPSRGDALKAWAQKMLKKAK